MQNDFQARHPGRQVSIDMDIYQQSCRPGADMAAIFSRVSMLGLLQPVADSEHFKFPWIHNGKPDEIVFKVVANIPMVRLQPGVEHEGFPFDIEELISQIERETEQ